MIQKRAAYYPMFADLRGRRCVVIGGGAIAQRKVAALLRCGAAVTVISPRVTPRLTTLASSGMIRHAARRFRPSDLSGAWLAIAATDDAAVNRLVFRSASTRRIFANVVDDAALCSFIAPSILRRGTVTVAVSTGGASPTIARRLRRNVSELLGAGYPRMARLMRTLRPLAQRRLPTYRARKRYFDDLVSGRVFALARAGDTRAAKQEALRQLGRASSDGG